MDDQLDLSDVVILRQAYERERTRRLELEEECDLLALTITDLQAQLQQYTGKGVTQMNKTPETKKTADSNKSLERCEGISVDRFDPSTTHYADSPARTIPAACGNKNVLCAEFLILSDTADIPYDIIVCGGVDMRVSLYLINDEPCSQSSTDSHTPIASYATGGPVLAISINKSRLAVGCMDGSYMMVS